MNKPLFLFVGKSASGKTTTANQLEAKRGYKQVQSYTTRPPRFDNEIGHIFITDEEFDNLGKLAAYTEYNGNRYGVTAQIIDESNIYVIDIPGVETLLKNYKTDRKIIAFYFDASVRTRIDRMLDRHDADMAIVSRIYNDEASDWYEELAEVIKRHNKSHDESKPVELHAVDANHDLDNVVGQIEFFMEGLGE